MAEDKNSDFEPKRAQPEAEEITSCESLRSFLNGIRERMADGGAPAVYALSALNYVMNLPGVYGFMDEENREIARDIWLHLKQSGFQLKDPPLLFEESRS